jgi:hypothetical protein
MAKQLRVDIRSLPYQFLFLVRKDTITVKDAELPDPGPRILGRASVGTKEVSAICCGEAGLAKHSISKASNPQLWKALKKHPESVRHFPQP